MSFLRKIGNRDPQSSSAPKIVILSLLALLVVYLSSFWLLKSYRPSVTPTLLQEKLRVGMTYKKCLEKLRFSPEEAAMQTDQSGRRYCEIAKDRDSILPYYQVILYFDKSSHLTHVYCNRIVGPDETYIPVALSSK